MFQVKRIWLLVSVVIIIFVSILTLSFLSKPQPVDLSAPVAKNVQAVITRWYQIQHDLACQPGTNVSVLEEVLIDSPDYRPGAEERETIQKAYGSQAVAQAGYLTSQKAYYLNRRSPIEATPEPGVRPTALPTYYCPDPPSSIDIDFRQVALGKEDRVTVQYDYGGGVFEAVLRKANGDWMITSIKLIKWHGI